MIGRLYNFIFLSALMLCLASLANSAKDEWDDSGKVVHLFQDDGSFTEFIDTPRSSGALILFYAPWCGHCKSIKPEFASASRKLDGGLVLAAVDCTAATDICTSFSVKSYPTLLFFADGDKDGVPYTEGRLEADLVAFGERHFAVGTDTDFTLLKVKALKKFLTDRDVSFSGLTDKSDLVALAEKSRNLPKVDLKKKAEKKAEKYNGRTWAQDNRAKKAKEAAAKGFGADIDDSAVTHLTDDTYAEFVKNNPHAFIMKSAEWCGACKSLKPHYAKAALELKGTFALGAIDCENNPEVCNKIASYPTNVYVNNGGQEEQVKFSDTKSIVKAAKKILDPTAPDAPKEPFVNEALWETNGNIVHLTSDHFDEYLAAHPNMIVMFYAPWCGHCKSFKLPYAEASTELEGDSTVLAAIDCTEQTEVCGKFKVNSYPTIKYFKGDTTGADYTAGRTSEAVVEFVRTTFGGQKKAANRYQSDEDDTVEAAHTEL